MTPKTARTSRPAILRDALTAVFDGLQGRTPSAQVRELIARARTYERAMNEWVHREPTPAQYGAMLDCVTELHEKVMRSEKSDARASIGPPRSGARLTDPSLGVSAPTRHRSSSG